MRVMVTGGAGFIGSHVVKALLARGCQVVVVDNLSKGHRDAVLGGTFLELDVRDTAALTKALRDHAVEAVLHFAAFSEVGESMRDPLTFYDNNVAGTLSLLQAMKSADVGFLIFSSTASVFGTPEVLPITEEASLVPVNVYGRTKLTAEFMIEDAGRAHGLRAVCLRYFNAAGADPEGELGERHDPESHLIPLALQAVLGRRPPLQLFGADHPTPDGTCIRDYVHVADLVQAHLLALDHLMAGKPSLAVNLGTGTGHSVREVLQAIERVTGKPVPHVVADRRAGDPAVLVASNAKAKEILGWEPRYPSLDDMVRHAWDYERRRI